MAFKEHLLTQMVRFNSMRDKVVTNDSPVVRATRSDNIADLQRLMQEGHLLSKKDNHDNTLLHVAATFRSLSVVDFLLTQGTIDIIDINDSNREGWTALFLVAAFTRSPPIVEKLLSAGADATLPDRYDITMLDYLLNCPGDPTPETASITLRLMESWPVECDSLLHVAALSDPQLLSSLINNGADVNAKNFGGNTPLHVAASMDSDASVELLLGAGADANARNGFGSTPLHLALDAHLSIPRRLIAAGADPDARDCDGRTALHDAARLGRRALATLLVDAGARADCPSDRREVPLHLAVADPADHGLEVALLLVERGADVDAEDCEGNTPLHAAAKAGNLEGAAMLLYHGADAQRTNKCGYTPFAVAVTHEHLEVQELLLEYETDFNRQMDEGESLLALAARCRSPLMWEILDRGGVITTVIYNDMERSDRSKEYQVIFERRGHKNFPAGKYDNVFGVAACDGLSDLFRYVIESEQLPDVLEDAYARRSQGLLSVHNLDTVRGDHHPAIEGILDCVLEDFQYAEAVKLIYILLSYGYEPDYLEVQTFFCCHGRCPMFDFLLDMDLSPHYMPKDCLLPTIILDVTHSVKKHVDYFRQHKVQVVRSLRLNITTILPYLTNANLFQAFKERLGKCRRCLEVPQGLDRIVPTLQELSRDSVRDSVCAMRHITSYDQFRKHVRSLHVGALWKLIMFRKPLY